MEPGSKKPLSIMMADIDFFKDYNDKYGHQAGDVCLKKISGCLRKTIRRAGELIARYGGEEFVIVLPVTDIQHSLKLAKKLCKAVYNLHIPHEGAQPYECLTISASIAMAIPGAGISAPDLVRKADEQL